MIIVDNVIVSDEFINARFCCHLARCKGECCIAGDAGAPLEPDEVGLIEEYIEELGMFFDVYTIIFHNTKSLIPTPFGFDSYDTL